MNIRFGSDTRLVRLGLSPYTIEPARKLYLVYRIDHLANQQQQIVQSFTAQANQWSLRGMSVLGLQLDFDSPSRGLGKYVDFLQSVRTLLPKQYKLSVTGLADWAVSAQPQALGEVSAFADEIIFQLYTGRAPIKNLGGYLSHLAKLNVEFKLGTLESMPHCSAEMQTVTSNPNFKGFVQFIIKAR